MRELVDQEAQRYDNFTWHDVKWAARECQRQRSGEMSVARLLEALNFARKVIAKRDPLLLDVQHLGWLVEPDKNKAPGPHVKWRSIRVSIGGVIPLPDPEEVPRKMNLLWDEWGSDRISSDSWYREFEEIHPFVDGNGRVGSILWNLRRGTIIDPVDPPDFWKDSNQGLLPSFRGSASRTVT